MRMVKIWAAVTCPLAAVVSWLELDGPLGFLAMLLLIGGGACSFILMREERAARGVDDPVTLNLHQRPASEPQNPL
jgi:hypothetical protein